MKATPFLVVFVLLVALVPVFLAVNQEVPAGSPYKYVVLLLSLAAFGLVLGQFWLSRLLPRSVVKIEPALVLRWHKVVGFSACGFLLIHPVLMVARRFWVQESDPVDNLLLVLRAPAMLPAIIGWVLLALLVGLSLVRMCFRPRTWRILHGLLSAGFAGLATWHVVAVGRHSNAAMSVLWIVLAVGAVGALLGSYLPIRMGKPSEIQQGVLHGWVPPFALMQSRTCRPHSFFRANPHSYTHRLGFELRPSEPATASCDGVARRAKPQAKDETGPGQTKSYELTATCW